MAPEYGATCGIFPVDDETLRYLRFTGRSAADRSRWSRPTRASRASSTARRRPRPSTRARCDLDLASVEPSVAGPKRPQDRVSLFQTREVVRGRAAQPGQAEEEGVRRRAPCVDGDTSIGYAPASSAVARREERLGGDRRDHQLHQHLEPVGAGGGRPAREEGGRDGAGDQAVGEDVAGAGLEGGHRLPRRGGADAVPRAAAASTSSATAARPASATPARCRSRSPTRSRRATWSCAACCRGNRNFEGRINPEVRANYLMSPPLVVAYALAGRIDIDLDKEPLGDGKRRHAGLPARHLAVGQRGRTRSSARRSSRRCSSKTYARRLRGRRALADAGRAAGRDLRLGPASTYIKEPPYFDGMHARRRAR